MTVCLMKLNCYSLIYSSLVWLWLLLHINSSICLSKDTWGQKSCLWSLTNSSRISLLPLWMSRCEDRQMSGSMSKLKTCLLIKMDLFHVLNCLHLDNWHLRTWRLVFFIFRMIFFFEKSNRCKSKSVHMRHFFSLESQ